MAKKPGLGSARQVDSITKALVGAPGTNKKNGPGPGRMGAIISAPPNPFAKKYPPFPRKRAKS